MVIVASPNGIQPDRITVRVVITPKAKAFVQAYREAHDMTQEGVISRVLEWLADEKTDEVLRAWATGLIPHDLRADAAQQIARSFASLAQESAPPSANHDADAVFAKAVAADKKAATKRRPH